MRMGFSDEVNQMEKRLDPYWNRYSDGTTARGIRNDSPPEIKQLFEEYKKRVEEESWLD